MSWEYVARCAVLDVDQREAVIDCVGQLPFLRLVRRRPSEATYVWTIDRPPCAWDEDVQICVQTVIPDGVYVVFHTGVPGDAMDQIWRAIREIANTGPFVDPWD